MAGTAPVVLPFRLWESQFEVLENLCNFLLVLILKARQLGISWLVCAYILHKCFFFPGQKAVLLSKGKGEAADLLERIMFMYHNLPPWMRAMGPRIVKQNSLEVEWDNGSNIESIAATQQAGRSITASIVVMDEAAFMLWASTIYTAVKPTIDAGGQLIVLSTANGIGNWFYSMWSRAKRGLSSFKTIFLPWWARPGRDSQWYAQQVKDADEPEMVKQEYPASAEEAFIASGRVKFKAAWLDNQAQYHRTPMLDFEIPDPLYDIVGLNLYTLPQHRAEYIISADVAEGLVHGDFSCAVVLDRYSWDEVASIHGHIDPDQFGVYLCRLGWFFNLAEVFVERNKDGQTTLLQMRTDNYLRIGAGEDGRPGWETNLRTKPLVINSLAKGLKEGHPKIRTAAAADEMRIFKLDDKGRLGAPDGFCDDWVMAWGIGVHQLTLPEMPPTSTSNYRRGSQGVQRRREQARRQLHESRRGRY